MSIHFDGEEFSKLNQIIKTHNVVVALHKWVEKLKMDVIFFIYDDMKFYSLLIDNLDK